ncbi:MAG: beta-lactamase family protein [Gammaproteobacteria bacterium]|nr:beta-lactamase family protein [Gammaproteobacteria bacterium]MYK48332.1 beta-lactamase family protein [Gammaproteobacteria bacterium]
MYLRTGLLTICAISAVAVCGGEIPVAKAESVGMSTERLQRIDAAMQRHIDAGKIQGVVTAVARRGSLVHFKAHGLIDVEAERPMPLDAIFVMASSTKPVLGVAAMILIDEGLMRPSDPVEKYIPEFADMQVAVLKDPTDRDISPRKVNRLDPPPHRLVPANTPITIEHLLTHTSGLVSGGLGTRLEPGANRAPLASYIPSLGDFALDFQPGSHWSYGGGLQVVARIIEVVSGMPYGEFLQTRIFDPLEMNDTHFSVPQSKMSRRVVIRGADMSKWDGERTSGGLWSTARDYLHFQQMLANGGELLGRRVLSPSAVEMMSSNHVGDLFAGGPKGRKGMGFGYTVSVVLDPIAAGSRRSAGAFGWGGAAGTLSWTDPAEELAGVIMLQQPYGPARRDFENAIRQAILD